MSKEAFDKWADQYDCASGEYLDMGIDEVFSAGYDSRQPEIDSLEAENRRLSDSLEAIDLDTKALLDEIDSLKEQNAILLNDDFRKDIMVKGLTQENAALKDVNRALLQASSNYYNENTAFKAEVERLESNLDTLGCELTEAEEENGQYERELLSLKSEVERLRTEKDSRIEGD